MPCGRVNCSKKGRQSRGLPANSLRPRTGNFLRPCRELNRAIREIFALIREIANGRLRDAVSTVDCPPTTAEYRPGSAIYGTEHCRSRATLVVGSIPVTDGALSILRAGLGNVRESFAILRSASSENDSAATPERDRPNRSAVVRSPAPAIRFPRTRGPCPTYISRPRMLGATLSPVLRQETVAVESFSLLALRRTAKLSLTTRRPESGGRSPRLAI